MTPCPVCGVMFSDLMLGKPGESESELSIHIIQAHGKSEKFNGCFCGWGTKHIQGGVLEHIIDNGGYEAHYMDFLMGIKEAE